MSAGISNNWLDVSEAQSISNRIFELVKSAGAEADLIIDRNQSLSLKASQGELEEHKLTQLMQLGLRLVKNQKIGTAYVEATDDDALKHLVNEALVNARYVSDEPHEKILNQSRQQETLDSILCPAESIELNDKIAFVLDLEQQILAEEKIKSVPYNGLSDVHHQHFICSSHGLFSHTRQHQYSTYAYALAEHKSQNAMEGKMQVARVFSDLDAYALSKQVVAESLKMLAGKGIASNHYDVIFSVDCLAQIWSVFMLACSAKSAKEGISPFREKLGKQVADARLSLFDRPLNQTGFGYTLFDSEGVPTQDTNLIDQGVLNTFLHNTCTASYFKQSSTGHASRGSKTSLNVSAHQLVIPSGQTGERALYEETVFEVTDLAGLHSGANAFTGDFSLGASGYLYKNGEQQTVVRGVTVAGNFYQMLNQIHSIGDQEIWDSAKSMCMPKISFSNLAISGS